MPCLERGWAGGQAVTAWQLDRPGDIAEGNKPVSFTLHRLCPYGFQFSLTS